MGSDASPAGVSRKWAGTWGGLVFNGRQNKIFRMSFVAINCRFLTVSRRRYMLIFQANCVSIFFLIELNHVYGL